MEESNSSNCFNKHHESATQDINNVNLGDFLFECSAEDQIRNEFDTNQDENLVDNEEDGVSTVFESPNGTMFWIPRVSIDCKPKIGTIFDSFEAAKKLYEEYAYKAGFETRLSTTKKVKGLVTHRYIVCNKHGKSKNINIDTLEDTSSGVVKRKRTYKVSDCMAGVKLKAIMGTTAYKLYDFTEKHNHPMIEDEHKDLTKTRCKLQYADKQFIQRVSQSNIGATVAYRMKTLACGGNEMVRGTVKEYKNFRRDVNLYIGERDAQMLVDKMVNKRDHLTNFSFNYKVADNELVGLFWADEVAKLNYESFGDVIAFDATYRTNKYEMIFVPFTGVDHHKKCVIFGAGLIGSEKIESYQWLLRCFVEAHRKQPTLILTDQDPAMKAAVQSVLTESKHRLCTWHITEKIPIKLKGDSDANVSLKTEIHKLAWNVHLAPDEFERRWKNVIEEYEMEDHKWLSEMYEIRESWIPGFFKDIPMCCLMKTTSRAESTNAMFRVYSSHHNTLVQFMLCYETAIESQRYKQRNLDQETKTTTPTFKTHLHIERFASKVYTHQMFLAVQKEIWKGVWMCSQKNVETKGMTEVCTIRDKQKESQRTFEFKVVIDYENNTLSCRCNNYGRIGYLCRHVFCALKDRAVDDIPAAYIHRRWRRDSLPDDIYKRQQNSVTLKDKRDAYMAKAISIVETCTGRLRGELEMLEDFVKKLEEMKKEVFAEVPNEPSDNDNEEVIKSLLGIEPPKEILLKAPSNINNKGSRKSKRMVGEVEKVKKKHEKTMRTCAYCGDYDLHDIRTCQVRKEDERLKAEAEKKRKEEAKKKGKGKEKS